MISNQRKRFIEAHNRRFKRDAAILQGFAIGLVFSLVVAVVIGIFRNGAW